jgi:uncharacterized protein with ATP-grasp and redox domains
MSLSTFEIPSFQIDPDGLPPPLLTSEPASFAYNTFKVRIPAIVEETIELNSFPGSIRGALEELRTEIVAGRIRALREETPDRIFWNQVSAPYIGRSWLDVPWYWAETFFYRRVLEATRYFQPGPWGGFDPYAAKKQTEWEPGAAPETVNNVLEALPDDPYARFEDLLHASLWGNRTDLSYEVATQRGSTREESSNLLVDDTQRIWRYLNQGPERRLAIITDNTGTELLFDLALIDSLLSEGLAGQVVLHLKPQPFFVSDAMPADVESGLKALETGGAAARKLGQRMRAHLAEERLQLYSHWLYATCLFYFQLPADLVRTLSAMDLVILKGDVNYRRLLGDAHWPPTVPFEAATSYFPTSLLTLRTLKAELIVGLREGEAERLGAQDPDWMVNARRGLIQARF